jgi:predicted RNase H-like HicB family nuclease
MTHYVAYIRKDADSDFGVEFPDLPGCFSAGSTVEETLAMAEDALAGHLAVLVDHGDPVPAPRSIDQLLTDPERGNALAVLIPADPDLHKPERVNVSLSRSLLKRIDARASNRSRFLAEAAEAKLSGDAA